MVVANHVNHGSNRAMLAFNSIPAGLHTPGFQHLAGGTLDSNAKTRIKGLVSGTGRRDPWACRATRQSQKVCQVITHSILHGSQTNGLRYCVYEFILVKTMLRCLYRRRLLGIYGTFRKCMSNFPKQMYFSQWQLGSATALG